jgi:L-iditol 2-dehydrogenase
MTVTSASMHAVVLRAPGDVVVEERPVPTTGPDEVLVRVTAVGVCGSDVHYVKHGRIGNFVVTGPMILGHEPAGVIVAVGSQVPPGRVGQRVSIEPGRPCRRCRYCLGGQYNLCPRMAFFSTPPVDGALSEYVVVHEAFAHPVPDSMSDDEAALLEPLSVGVWSCRKAGVGIGTRVLVTGAGAVGLVAMQVARAAGAAQVVVTDVDRGRLTMAAELGADSAVDASSSRLDPTFQPDVILECSGNLDALQSAVEVLAPAGRVVLVGAGFDDLILPMSLIQPRELQIVGIFRYANTWPAAIDLVRSGRVVLEPLVTSHVGLADSPAVLSRAAPDPGEVKTVVLPQQ